MNLPKVRILRDNLRQDGWHMTGFSYDYNHHSYIVLFEDAKELGCRNKYTMAYITFMDRANLNRILEVEANTRGFDSNTPASEIMNYFFISDKTSGIGFFNSFGAQLNAAMPERFIPPTDQQMKTAEITQLGKRNNDPNPAAVYCYDIRRNPRVNGVQYYRSIYNSNKAAILKPRLYERLARETTVSFFFCDDSSMELSDEELLMKFVNRENV